MFTGCDPLPRQSAAPNCPWDPMWTSAILDSVVCNSGLSLIWNSKKELELHSIHLWDAEKCCFLQLWACERYKKCLYNFLKKTKKKNSDLIRLTQTFCSSRVTAVAQGKDDDEKVSFQVRGGCRKIVWICYREASDAECMGNYYLKRGKGSKRDA